MQAHYVDETRACPTTCVLKRWFDHAAGEHFWCLEYPGLTMEQVTVRVSLQTLASSTE